MTEEASQLLEKALQLPAEERDEIANQLFDSLEPNGAAAELDAYWAEEIKRRLEDLDQGRTRTVPWEEVRRSLIDAVHDEPAAG